MPCRRPIRAPLALAVAFAFAPGHAQESHKPAAVPAETTLPAVTVIGDVESAAGPVSGYVARRSNTATKADAALIETPQSISVIGAEQVRDQASQNMQEVLRYSAGVRSEMYGVDNRGDWFTLRGGSEGSVLVDGLRRAQAATWGNVRDEPYGYERIEVLRGPASVIAGQNGPGGVVNLVSKRPQAEAASEIGVQLGNYKHKLVNVDLTGPLNEDGTLLYRLVALAKDSDTQVDHAFDEREFFAPSLSWRPVKGTSLTLFGEYQRDESGNLNAFFPFQGTILPAPNGPIPSSTFIGEPDWDTYGGKRKRFGYHVEQQLGSNWTMRHNLRHDQVDGKMRTMYALWFDGFVDGTGNPAPNGTYLNRSWYFNDDEDRMTNADLLFEGKLKFGGVQHTLLAGIDSLSKRSSQKGWDGMATPLDVYRPVYGTFPLPVLGPVDAANSRVRRIGVLLQDQIKVDERWVLLAGIRRDKSRTGADGGATQKDAATSRNLGLVYLADGGLAPYASYAESFEPVSGTDAAGAVFKPMRGKQLEAGVKWQPADKRLTASAAVYQLVEKNRTAADPVNIDKMVQRGEITVKGLELETAANLKDWDLTASYTYMDARVSSTTAADVRYLDQQLYSIPKQSGAVWALRKFGNLGLPGLRAGLGLRHVGKVWDGVGGQSVPAVTLADMLVAYDLGAWRIALNVNNLADKDYIAGCMERGDCWFGSRRKAVLSATYRW